MISASDIALPTETLDAADLGIVEMVCRFANVENDSALRTTLIQLAVVCAEGSLCIPIADTELKDATGAARYSTVIGNSSEAKPLILHRGRLYFHRHFHAEKKVAEGFLQRLKQESISVDLEITRLALRETLEEKPLRTQRQTHGAGSSPIQLTDAQKWALASALRERIFLLSGGPGTGKTALTASLLRVLIRARSIAPHRIKLCAPTGRAAQRLQESLQNSLLSLGDLANDDPDHLLLKLPVETLHRLLGYHPPSGKFARHPGDPLQADIVLLDEASMADAFTLAALVQALPADAALILVGDADQLPAVGAGSVLSELLPLNRKASLSAESWKWISEIFPETFSDNVPPKEIQFSLETVPTVILNRSHRSQQSLLDFADAINQGDIATVLQAPRIGAPNDDYAAALPDLLNDYAQSLFLDRRIQGKTYSQWLDVARDSGMRLDADSNSLSNSTAALFVLMEFLNSERILTCTRHGGLGCDRVNTLLRRKLEPIFDERSSGRNHHAAFHGAPILITRNDARTGLSNGEIGIWLRDQSGLTAYFLRGGEWLKFPAAFLPSWELAFATTVHKSQGSECDEVFLILAEDGNRLLTREIVYTAVTRAKKSVRIFGSEVALREAIRERTPRYSGLREYFLPSPLTPLPPNAGEGNKKSNR